MVPWQASPSLANTSATRRWIAANEMIRCHRQPHFQRVTICHGYNLCLSSREGLSAHGWARTFRSLAAGKSNGKRIVFMYHLCTIYVQFFVLSHITINELRHQICTIAYKRVFSESSQSQKPKQSHVCYPLVSYRDRTCLRILFFVVLSTYSPYSRADASEIFMEIIFPILI